MKLISLFFITIFLGKSCDAEQKQELESAKIEYTANTRGFYQNITIQNQTVTISKDRDGLEKPLVKKIADNDWKKMIKAFQEIDLEGLPNLVSPTQKRFYDGAAIANMTIMYKDKTYESANFDHGIPPVAIEKFVNQVTVLALSE